MKNYLMPLVEKILLRKRFLKEQMPNIKFEINNINRERASQRNHALQKANTQKEHPSGYRTQQTTDPHKAQELAAQTNIQKTQDSLKNSDPHN